MGRLLSRAQPVTVKRANETTMDLEQTIDALYRMPFLVTYFSTTMAFLQTKRLAASVQRQTSLNRVGLNSV